MITQICSVILRTFLIILLSWLCQTEIFAKDNTDYSAAKDFISRQEIIRACIGSGPGFGDQAMTMNVMARLRELGFKGIFEVLYDKDIISKVITLFNLPAQIPSLYEDKDKKITFIELEAYQKREINKPVELGVAVDKGGEICDPHIADTKIFLEFSPYFDSTNTTDQTDISYQDKPSIYQYNSGSKYFIFPLTTYEQAKQLLQNDSNGKEIIAHKPALTAFLDGIDNQHFNVLPVYGRTLRFKLPHSSEPPVVEELSESPSNMLQTLAGARYAQLHGPAEFHKPLIVAFFDDYNAYAKIILSLLTNDNWDTYEQLGTDKAKAALRELSLATALSIADISDPDAADKIKSLKEGQILLLSLGKLPKIVFDGIYSYQAKNMWPSIYEGAATFSMLALSSKPRFECNDSSVEKSGWTAGFDLIKDPLLKNLLQDFYSLSKHGYCRGLSTYKPGGMYHGPNASYHEDSRFNYMGPWEVSTYKTLGQLIIDANDPHSAFSRYFEGLHNYVLQPDNDRILDAIQHAIE